MFLVLFSRAVLGGRICVRASFVEFGEMIGKVMWRCFFFGDRGMEVEVLFF